MVSVSNHPGPADYTGEDVNLGPGVIIDNTNWLVSDDPPAYHVMVNPDGSGSFTFSGLHSGSMSTGTVSDVPPAMAYSGCHARDRHVARIAF